MNDSSFPGFSPDAIEFLRELAAHNERSWFQPRKAEFERLLKEPMEELCLALSGEFAARGLDFEADPVRSPYRIYRDVRFSKDKSPYKTYVSASFPWTGGQHHGGGYFSLRPDEAYVGGGVWHPDPAWLSRWRAFVDEDDGALSAAIEAPEFVREFGSLDGERLKRVPSGYAADHPQAEILKLKDVTFGHRLTAREVGSAALPGRIASVLAAAAPLMRLLAAIPT